MQRQRRLQDVVIDCRKPDGRLPPTVAVGPAPPCFPFAAMPANAFNGLTDYGIGIGLRVPHYDHILTEKPAVNWFEIISENFMVDGGRPLKVLDQILEQ